MCARTAADARRDQRDRAPALQKRDVIGSANGLDQGCEDGRAGAITGDMGDAGARMRSFEALSDTAFVIDIERHA